VNTNNDANTISRPDRMVPHSIEAEEAFLGAILINPEMLDSVPDLTPDDFFIVRNAYVWEAMVRLCNAGDEIDYVTVVEELRRQGRLEEIGGAAYVTYLLNNTPSSVHAYTYGALVGRASYRRQAISTASEIAQLAHAENLDTPEVQARIDAAVEKLYDRLPKQEVYLPGRDALRFYGEVLKSRQADDAPKTLTLPWEGFARYVPAIPRGKIIVVSAFTGEGKTLLLEGIAEWWAILGNPTLYITAEMTREDHLDRMTCRHTGLSYPEVISPTEDSEQIIARLGEKVQYWLPYLDIWETKGANARAVFRQIERAYKMGKRIFFIDYISRIPVDVTAAGTYKKALDNFITSLEDFAKRTGSTIVIASQLTNSEFGPHTAETKVLEQIASLHIRLETVKAKKESRIYSVDDRLVASPLGKASPMMVAHIAKNRFGPFPVDVSLFKDGERFRFLDEFEVSYSVAYSSKDFDEAMEQNARRREPKQAKLDLAGF
jgi:replicative DNA helicase